MAGASGPPAAEVLRLLGAEGVSVSRSAPGHRPEIDHAVSRGADRLRSRVKVSASASL
jgi:hypothetical protein